MIEQVKEEGEVFAHPTHDEGVNAVLAVLAPYQLAHPKAKIDIHRRNNVSVRIRIIDPAFKKLNRVERKQQVWPLLEQLPDEVFLDITMLLLLTPEEAKTSYASYEYDHPIPWPFPQANGSKDTTLSA